MIHLLNNVTREQTCTDTIKGFCSQVPTPNKCVLHFQESPQSLSEQQDKVTQQKHLYIIIWGRDTLLAGHFS